MLDLTLEASVKLLLTSMKAINTCLLKTQVLCICLTSSKDSPKFQGAPDETIFIHVKTESLILHCLPLEYCKNLRAASVLPSPSLQSSFCPLKVFSQARQLAVFQGCLGHFTSEVHRSTVLMGILVNLLEAFVKLLLNRCLLISSL